MPIETTKRHNLDRSAADLAASADGSPDDLLTSSDVAEWLGMSVSWLEIGRHKGYGPRFTRLSHSRVRYRRSDVLEWLDKRKHQCTSEYLAREA